MDTNTLIGIFATIVVAFLSYLFTVKKNNRTAISYIEAVPIQLFESAIRDLEDLEVLFKGKKIDENLILYEGTFYNTGNVDIDSSSVFESLKVVLPNNFKWKKIRINIRSTGVKIDYTLTESYVSFKWPILKVDEFFSFNSVIEYVPNRTNKIDPDLSSHNITKELSEQISFAHRITNLKKIKKQQSNKLEQIGLLKFTLTLISPIIALLIIYNATFNQIVLKPPYTLIFENSRNIGNQPRELNAFFYKDSLNKYHQFNLNKTSAYGLKGTFGLQSKDEQNTIQYVLNIILLIVISILIIMLISNYIKEQQLIRSKQQLIRSKQQLIRKKATLNKLKL